MNRLDASDGLVDPDLDGSHNLTEFQFDTNPQVHDQYPLSISLVPVTGSISVTFATTPGRTYCVHSSTDLLTWEICSNLMEGTGYPVTWVDTRVEATDSAPASGQPARYFYRIGLTMNP